MWVIVNSQNDVLSGSWVFFILNELALAALGYHSAERVVSINVCHRQSLSTESTCLAGASGARIHDTRQLPL
jgi:hypothetical protein